MRQRVLLGQQNHLQERRRQSSNPSSQRPNKQQSVESHSITAGHDVIPSNQLSLVGQFSLHEQNIVGKD